MRTFKSMEGWNAGQLLSLRKQLRDSVATETQKRDALKAEIMFLEQELEKFAAAEAESGG